MKHKARNWFLKNIIYFVVAIASIVFIIYGTIAIEPIEDATLEKIIANSGIILLISFSVTALLDLQGVIKGEETEEVLTAKREHAISTGLAEPHAKDLDDHCDEENRKELIKARRKILAQVGIDYEDCFDENGKIIKKIDFGTAIKPNKQDYIAKNTQNQAVDARNAKAEYKQAMHDYRKTRADIKAKERAYKKALKVSISEITTQYLLSYGEKQRDRFDFGGDYKKHLKQSSIQNLASKTIFALIFGYYTIKTLTDFSWAMLIWNALQVVLFLMFGFMKFFQSYMFMQNEFAGSIKKRTNEIDKFLSDKGIDKGKTKALEESKITEDILERASRKIADKFEIVE